MAQALEEINKGNDPDSKLSLNLEIIEEALAREADPDFTVVYDAIEPAIKDIDKISREIDIKRKQFTLKK